MKRFKHLFTAGIIGFVVAMVVMSIAIFFGYTDAYETSVDSMYVKILGVPVFVLKKSGDSYVGRSLGPNMGAICLAFIFISIIIQTIGQRIIKQKTQQR